MRLFQKKKAVRQTRLTLLNDAGKPVYQGPVNELSLPEELVIQKSIEFFNDPEPCYIHRGAVLTRLYGELEQFAGERLGEHLALNDLPASISRCMEEYPEAVRFSLEWKDGE